MSSFFVVYNINNDITHDTNMIFSVAIIHYVNAITQTIQM